MDFEQHGNDQVNDLGDSEPFDPIELERPVRPSGNDHRARRATMVAAAAGTFLIGGAAALSALTGPASVAAESNGTTAALTASDPSASPGATPAASPGAAGALSTSTWDHPGDGHGNFGGGLGPNHEAVSDTSVAAKAIGISETDLVAALRKGQTIAQVATTNNVGVQKVIDALVTDGLDELATAVKKGQLTQAQADAMKTEVTQRATDQVNGTFAMGRGDHNGDFGGGLGPNHEAVSDTSVAAKAIGISETDLVAALRKGQTIAQVATTNNVGVQKVIDALVTDGLDELATAVKKGQLTQAQADAMKTEVTQRATDQVNGTFGPGVPH